MSSRKPALAASCSSTGIRRRFRGADESRLRSARRRSGSHDLQYPLAPRADRLERAARQGRPGDCCAREHAAVADDGRHLALGRAALQAPARRSRNRTRLSTIPAQLDSGVRYGYIPDAAHTDGDLYVHFPEQNVLAVGDAVSGQGWPVVDWTTGGWIGGIVGGLQRLQTLANAETRIVPARGPVLGLSDLKAQYEMYGTIYDRLTQLLNKGRGPGEAVAARPTQEFDAQMGNPDEFVRRAFESLWAYVSPDA